MKVIINSQPYETNFITINEILNELQIQDKVMAVAVNMKVVKKQNWDSFEVKQNDEIEFLNFVGGG